MSASRILAISKILSLAQNAPAMER